MLKGFFISFLFLSLIILFENCKSDKQKKVNEQTSDSVASEILNHPQFKDLSAAIKKNPDNPEVYYKRGQAFLASKYYEGAINDFQKALNLNDKDVKYYYGLAEAYFLSKQVKKAIETLNQAIKIDPNNFDSHARLAWLYYYVKSYDPAIQAVNEAIRLQPFNERVYYLKGNIYKEKGDTLKAISSYQTAVEQRSDFYEAYLQLGLLEATQNNKLAIDYLDNALRIDSNSIEALYGKAHYYQDAKDFKKALALYKKIIEKDPQFAKAFYNLGYIYLEMDSLQKANKYFDLTIKMLPEYGEAYFGRGFTYEQLGKKDLAKMDYQNALNILGEHEEAENGLQRVSPVQ